MEDGILIASEQDCEPTGGARWRMAISMNTASRLYVRSIANGLRTG